jgi:glycine hydroxymethyltransferase
MSFSLLSSLSDDPILEKHIQAESVRQVEHLELIASENYTSLGVMQAQGSVLTNKYAEGYPGKRYYGGCVHVDAIEQIAIERAQQLFMAKYVNVQPHSGSQANAAVFQALIAPGATIMGMRIDAGGHLTHGLSANFSGKQYNAVSYGVDDDGIVDMGEVRRIALENKPAMIIAGFSAYSRVLDWAAFREIADEVGAYLFVDMSHVSGLVAAGLYPCPMQHAHVVTTTTHKTLGGPRGGIILSNEESLFKKLNSAIFPGTQGGPLMHVIAAKAFAFKQCLTSDFRLYQEQVRSNARLLAESLGNLGHTIISGGTDVHMFMLDTRSLSLTGKEAEALLEAANITVNKNTIPNDPASPFVTSGLRIGTPAVTRRGMVDKDMHVIATYIDKVLRKEGPPSALGMEVAAFCRKFPLYGE